MKEIYFDNSATTKPYPEAVDQARLAIEEMFHNPSSIYSRGIAVSRKMEEIREITAETINAKPRSIVFTSGGTESINTAIISALRNSRGRHIVTTEYEHDATLNIIKKYEREGWKVTYIKPEDGKIEAESILNAVSSDTALVSVMHVNNETGNIIDINLLGTELKKKNPGTALHIDAVQSYMKLRLDVEKCSADYLSISGHKIHAVKGTGVLYVRDTSRFNPVFLGGGQEKGYRSGTENTPGIFAFGKAVELNYGDFNKKTEYIRDLRDYFRASLEENIENIRFNSPEEGVCHILNVSFKGAKAEILLHTLESRGIYVSTGSACSSKKKGSHVLRSLGLRDIDIEGAIRFSLSSLNTKEEIDSCISELKAAVEDIRMITKFGRR